MKKRLLTLAMLVLVIAGTVGATTASGSCGRFDLYLVNSGPTSPFYNDSTNDGEPQCDQLNLPSSLSTSPGKHLRQDSVGFIGDSSDPGPGASTFSYTVPARHGFTIKANPNAITLKLWAFSGDRSCDEPGVNDSPTQVINWSLECTGPTCGSVDLSSGYQDITIPEKTPINTLQNVHFGVSSPVKVGAGDTITLRLASDFFAPIQWNAAKGPGASLLSILTN